MNLQKIKEVFFGFIKALWRFVCAVYKRFSIWMNKLLERLPIPAKFRPAIIMTTLSLTLVVVVVLAIPLFRTVADVTESVVETITGEADNDDKDEDDNSSYIDPNVIAPTLDEPLPVQMEVPKNDILHIPTGGTAWRFTDSELLKLQRLMTFAEKCESFDYNDPDKDAAMALTAYRLLLETNDPNVTYNADPAYYSVRHLHLQKHINQLFGRNLSSTDKLGDILFTDNTYLYFQKSSEPAAVSGYVSEAYTLGEDYYKITGIVTRGFSSDAGRYSRKISMILLKHKSAEYGYYIVSLVNEPMSYTYLDSLLKTLPPDESTLVHFGQRPTTGTTSGTVSGNTASVDPVTSKDPVASADPNVSQSPEESTSSTTPVEEVVLPEIGEHPKASVSKADEESLQKLLMTVPVSLTDFDVSRPSSESLRMLTAHIQLCTAAGQDYQNEITTNKYGDINELALKLFGVQCESVTADTMDTPYSIDPYITTGRTEFKDLVLYDLGNNRYLLVCDAAFYSNPLLEAPDQTYQYTALLEKSADAMFGYYLKAQKFILK